MSRIDVADLQSWPSARREWTFFLLGFAVLFVVFDRLATGLGSVRGEFGPPVAAAVLVLLAATVMGLRRQRLAATLNRLGLGKPKLSGLGIGALLSLGLVLAGIPFLDPGWTWYPNAPLLAAGIFLQAGVAEEALFRGYLFGQLRTGRTFARAAGLATPPFVAVHMLHFFLFPFPIAAASVGLALLLSFPLARLYELSGNTIWAPALLHAVIQAGPKLVSVPEGNMRFAIAWMGATALVSYGVFLFPKKSPERLPPPPGSTVP